MRQKPNFKKVTSKPEFLDYLKDQKENATNCTIQFWLQELYPFQNLSNDCVNALIVVLQSGEYIFLPSTCSPYQRDKILGVKLLKVYKWAMLPCVGHEDNPSTIISSKRLDKKFSNRVRNLDGHAIVNE